MPTYPYACTACDHRFEVVQAFTDDALTECPQCSGRLRKVFGSVGVVFKGSGFYRTDSRSSSSSAAPASHASTSTSSDSGASSSSKDTSAKAGAKAGSSSPASTTASTSSAA